MSLAGGAQPRRTPGGEAVASGALNVGEMKGGKEVALGPGEDEDRKEIEMAHARQ